MKTNLTFGTIYIPEYVVKHIEKTYHTNEMNNFQKYSTFKLDKTKSNQISQSSSFEEILKQKLNSVSTK